MRHRLIALLMLSAVFLQTACVGGVNAGGAFDCARWRRRADEATADVRRQEDQLQFIPYKGLGDTRRRVAVLELQDARLKAARLEARANRACATGEG